MERKLVVLRDRVSKTYGVYAQPASDGTGQELIEGGFFERSAAIEAKDEIEMDALRDEVEIAERRAGWDPYP